MTDLIGPASSLNSVQQRPSDGRQFGPTDTWFKDCTTPASQDGTQIVAAWYNQVTGLLRSAIRAPGLRADGATPVTPQDQGDGMLANAIAQMIQRGQATYALDTGSADALVATPVGAPVIEYKAGLALFVLKGPKANATAAPTLNAGGLGAVPIVRGDGGPLAAGDLPANTGRWLWFDGTSFRLVTLSRSEIAAIVAAALPAAGAAPVCYVVDGGAADALAGPGAPAIAAYTAGQLFVVVKGAAANATAAPTLAVGPLAAKPIVKAGGGALAAADLPGGACFLAVYDGASMRLLQPTASDIAAIVAGFTPAPGDGGCLVSVQDPTHLLISAFNGGTVYINGAPQIVPAAGVQVGNTSAGTGLQPNTRYYLYGAVAAGAFVGELSSIVHVPDALGRRVKSGDPTRRLLAVVYTNGAGQFQDTPTFRGLRNWFNRPTLVIDTGALPSTTMTAGNNSTVGPILLNSPVTFVVFADDYVRLRANVQWTALTSNEGGVQILYIDGASIGSSAVLNFSGAPGSASLADNTSQNANLFDYAGFMAEGAHTAQIAVKVFFNGSAGGVNPVFYPQLSGTVKQ